MDSIVSVNWLNENLENPDVIILDASLQKTRVHIASELTEYTIKKARYFDLKNKFSDVNNPFPNAFPSKEQFETNCQLLGINDSSIIVVFDIDGIYSSPRAWWLLRTMGHKNVAILDGGFPEWILNKFPIEKIGSRGEYVKGNFKVNLDKKSIRNFHNIYENLESKKELVMDVRSEERFKSLVPEPRKGLRSGNIPNSINLPYTKLLTKGKYKTKKELKEIFERHIQEQKPLVFSCGSGITACIVLLASDQILSNKKSIYDGSWTEWGEKIK
ncbi:sulfurtransferase [Maribacter sp.]|uniref:sulfurtransferase n=1 Tax=Maribacter sp. TaxID=1897614 RepID=UPI0025C5E90C|nr:sulfurtransferase [Maribacter sp.]